MKLLFSLLLSGLILAPLASFARVKTNSGRVIEFKPQTGNALRPVEQTSAFRGNLTATKSCSGTCLELANLNMPAEAKDFLNRVPLDNVVRDILLVESANLTSNLGNRANSAFKAIANAVRLSQVEKWPEAAKNNLANFVRSLTDNITDKEGIKLQEVISRCRV